MVKKNDQQESIEEISRQAAVIWVLLKDGAHLSVDDAWRILLWLLRSRRHVHELLLMRRQDARLTRLLKGDKQSSNVVYVDWRQKAASKPAQPPPRSHRVRWSIAATVLLMVTAVLFIASGSDEGPDEKVASVAEELQTHRLEDGSLVSLDALAAMRVEFTERQRGVHLFHGNPLFDVVAGPERPFVVHTLLVDITSVVESKFAVRIDTSVEVEVFEGVVEVSGRQAKAGSPVVTVKKGQRYRVPVGTFRAILAGGSGGSRGRPDA